MNIYIDALRDIAANHGWPICDEAADELEDHERAYELLFNENARLKVIEDAARNLVAQKGRFNSRMAYERLEASLKTHNA